MEGVCMKCGSLHLGGACEAMEGADPGDSAAVPVYGPWMLAIRQRRVISKAPASQRGPVQLNPSSSSPSGSPGTQGNRGSPNAAKATPIDGWEIPAKVARRRPSSSVKQGTSAGQLQTVAETGGVSVPVKVRAGFNPVSESTEKGVEGNLKVMSSNPFASALAEGDEAQLHSKDVCPGPLKRARPETTPVPRSVAKLDKRKGKSKTSLSSIRGLTTFSPILKDLIPEGQIDGQEGQGISSDPKALEPGAVPLLQPSNSFEFGQGSASLIGAQGSSMTGGLIDSIMMEDQGDAPSSS